MIAGAFRVVLDANVLFPFTLRDTLLRAAAAGLFQAYWSDEILDETRRNLVDQGVMSEAKAGRLVAVMNAAFPEARVTGHELLAPAMKTDPKDRHVAAAAVKVGAQVVVTSNLKDFRDLPEGLEAQSPDEFLCNLFDLDPERMMELLEDQAASLKNPPFTITELLDALAKTVPDFVIAVRADLAET